MNIRPCIHPEPRLKAVHRCCQARNRALVDCKGLKLSEWATAELSTEAYLASMPDLLTTADVKDYAACVNHAIALGLISTEKAPQLLASARIVLDALRSELKDRETGAKLAQADRRLDLTEAKQNQLPSKMPPLKQDQTQTAA